MAAYAGDTGLATTAPRPPRNPRCGRIGGCVLGSATARLCMLEAAPGNAVAEAALPGLGRLLLITSTLGLLRVDVLPAGSPRVRRAGDREALRLIDRARDELAAYPAGGALTCPADLTCLPLFRQRVLLALRGIPRGHAASYGEIAARIGSPGAARAVGGACGANPVLLWVPCHRVLAAGGRLGGFSGGLAMKRRLLALEGIAWR
jgi:methylated-DNA-[protein]-cysteine S-methyltransferase